MMLIHQAFIYKGDASVQVGPVLPAYISFGMGPLNTMGVMSIGSRAFYAPYHI
jgi:hypothetical protein